MSHPIVAFARDVLGFPLKPKQAAVLAELYEDRIRYGVLRCGRRSGKGRLASIVAVYEATVNADAHLAAVPPGEQVAVVVVATSRSQARVIHRFIRSFLNRPLLAAQVVRDAEDEIELRNGMVIVTMPSSARSTRGYGIAVLVFDEMAWMIDTDGSPLDANALWDALVPSTATFPAAKVLALSTPRWNSGFFAELCKRAVSGKHPDMRHWHYSTAQMRPDISVAFLATEYDKDPVAFRREYGAEFVAAIAAVFEEEPVRKAVANRGALDPQPGWKYWVATDPAYTGDRWGTVVGHMAGDRLIVDRVLSWRGTRNAPLQHGPVLDQLRDLALAYNNATVLVDQYAAQPIIQGLRERGVYAVQKAWRNTLRTDAVTAARQLFYTGRIELPDAPELVAELLGYEQSILPSGKPRYDAAPGQTDDLTSALLALTHEVAAPPNVATSRSYLPPGERGEQIVTRKAGGLTLVGAGYVDQPPPKSWTQMGERH